MARYARRYRKGRRSNRTLSTRRIFSNKSAKAQAKQIAALKKRINRVYNRTKPEYKVVRSQTENRVFGWELNSDNFPVWVDSSAKLGIVTPAVGAADNQRIGNMIRIAPINVFFNARYQEKNNIINSVYPYIQHPLESNGIKLRFVAVQAITANNASPDISDIFQDEYVGPGNSAEDVMMMLTMPFRNGITTRFKILKDKRITVTKDNPIYAARFKIKPAIKTLRWEDGQANPAGMIYYIIIGAGADVRSVEVEGSPVYNFNYVNCTWRHELTYTDA